MQCFRGMPAKMLLFITAFATLFGLCVSLSNFSGFPRCTEGTTFNEKLPKNFGTIQLESNAFLPRSGSRSSWNTTIYNDYNSQHNAIITTLPRKQHPVRIFNDELDSMGYAIHDDKVCRKNPYQPTQFLCSDDVLQDHVLAKFLGFFGNRTDCPGAVLGKMLNKGVQEEKIGGKKVFKLEQCETRSYDNAPWVYGALFAMDGEKITTEQPVKLYVETLGSGYKMDVDVKHFEHAVPSKDKLQTPSGVQCPGWVYPVPPK